MNSKLILTVIAVFFLLLKTTGQVVLQKGSFEKKINLYDLKDPLSNLSVNLSLNYSSGNGVLVDEIPSCIGQGWSIGGLGVVTRIQRGTAPDDQVKMDAGSIPIQFRYPDGYIFNSTPVTNGCPTLLNRYPIYEEENIEYYIDNRVNADKEQDIFMFSFAGRTGKFVIDKNKKPHMLGDTRIKFKENEPILFDPWPILGCRTLINKFTIVDENGIEYEFGRRDYSKSFDYHAESENATETKVEKLLQANDILLDYNPYITYNWYLTKITDPLSNRSININYREHTIDMFSGYSAQYSLPVAAYTNDEITHPTATSVLKLRMYFKKPEVSIIQMPNRDYVYFNYNVPRKDCKNSFMLNEIVFKNGLDGNISKFTFQQSYFVKNLIKEPAVNEEKFSRLVLKQVNKTAGNQLHRIASFEYYTGTGASENFVPPIFFHAKDPWGFYNGSYCGVNVSDFLTPANIFSSYNVIFNGVNFNLTNAELLATHNSPPASGYHPGVAFAPTEAYMRSNVKPSYAANGLLSKIINEYGGETLVEYEQNQFNPTSGINLFANNNNSIEINKVGGVHVKTVSEYEKDANEGTTTYYKYTLPDGITSSLWGAEFPCHITVNNTYWEPEEIKSNCDYEYKNPGVINHVIIADKGSSFGERFDDAIRTYNESKILIAIATAETPPDLLDAILVYLNSLICPNDKPTDHAAMFTNNSSIINFQNALPMQFKRVEVIKTSYPLPENNGKTIYEFTSPDDPLFPLLVPHNTFPYKNKPRYYDWAYGLPKTVKVYNNAGKLLKSTEKEFLPVYNNPSDITTKSCNCEPAYSRSWREDHYRNNAVEYANTTVTGEHPNAVNSPRLFVEFYNHNAGHAKLNQMVEKVYDKDNNEKQWVTNYTYFNANYQPSIIQTSTSEGKKIEKKIYYPEHFEAIPVGSSSAIRYMPSYNIVNLPVVTETWQVNGENKKLLSFTATDFEKIGNGGIKPVSTYQLITKAPIPQAMTGILDGTSILLNIPEVQQTSSITYNADGQPVQTNDLIANRVGCTIYGYDKQYSIGTVSNAERAEVAYTSFENKENGDWGVNDGVLVEDVSPTGISCLSGSFGLSSPFIPSGKDFTLSFWSTDPSPLVNTLTPVISGPVIGSWRYFQYTIPSSNTVAIQISGSGKLDEVRLYPANASMKTVTYYPSFGKSAECDENNRIIYFEYDSLGRLLIKRNEKREVVKTYEYHYKTQ